MKARLTASMWNMEQNVLRLFIIVRIYLVPELPTVEHPEFEMTTASQNSIKKTHLLFIYKLKTKMCNNAIKLLCITLASMLEGAG